ncbi:CaiB/BaiF CoA transferase family protein [Chloroflexota bacterium]
MRKEESEKDTALDDIRVLDLAGPMGVYGTKLLADLGADVIKIEPPGGGSMRALGPFVDDDPHPEKSLYFFHFNTNKRGITLNLDTRDGQEIFKSLVKSTDVVVETFPPGYMDSLGLGYEDLKTVNPRIIMGSVTGFGQTGPYRDFKSYDIVGVATGGLMYLGGFMGEPPNYTGGFQGYHLAGSDIASGILVALYHRDLTGEGQYVDVSMQQSVAMGIEHAMTYYDARKRIRRRTGRQVYRGWNEVFPCKDGYVMCGPLGGASWRKVLEWMDSEGMAVDLKNEKYTSVLEIMVDRQMDRQVTSKRQDPRMLAEYPEEITYIEKVWEDFLLTHTREELYEECQKLGVRLMPINSARDLLEDPHLQQRGFFTDVAHRELGKTFKYQGPPYRLYGTPWRIKRRSPLIGEHNKEIYIKELGLSKEELVVLKQGGVI